MVRNFIKKLRNFVYLYTSSEYSMQLNASRIKVLQAQDEVVNSMKDAAKKGLLRLSSDKKVYKKLIKEIIVQVLTCLTMK